jgi:hypothetical protein
MSIRAELFCATQDLIKTLSHFAATTLERGLMSIVTLSKILRGTRQRSGYVKH